MAFNLNTWYEQFKSALKSWKQRVINRKVDSLYGALAATALWVVRVRANAFECGHELLNGMFEKGISESPNSIKPRSRILH